MRINSIEIAQLFSYYADVSSFQGYGGSIATNLYWCKKWHSKILFHINRKYWIPVAQLAQLLRLFLPNHEPMMVIFQSIQKKKKPHTSCPILHVCLSIKHFVSQQAFHRTDLFTDGRVGESPISFHLSSKKILKHGWAFGGVLWGFLDTI